MAPGNVGEGSRQMESTNSTRIFAIQDLLSYWRAASLFMTAQIIKKNVIVIGGSNHTIHQEECYRLRGATNCSKVQWVTILWLGMDVGQQKDEIVINDRMTI